MEDNESKTVTNFRKYKKFESFMHEKAGSTYNRQVKIQNNSVFYYFPVL